MYNKKRHRYRYDRFAETVVKGLAGFLMNRLSGWRRSAMALISTHAEKGVDINPRMPTCSVRPRPIGFNPKGAISISLSTFNRCLSVTTPTLTSAFRTLCDSFLDGPWTLSFALPLRILTSRNRWSRRGHAFMKLEAKMRKRGREAEMFSWLRGARFDPAATALAHCVMDRCVEQGSFSQLYEVSDSGGAGCIVL